MQGSEVKLTQMKQRYNSFRKRSGAYLRSRNGLKTLLRAVRAAHMGLLNKIGSPTHARKKNRGAKKFCE